MYVSRVWYRIYLYISKLRLAEMNIFSKISFRLKVEAHFAYFCIQPCQDFFGADEKSIRVYDFKIIVFFFSS